MIGSEHPADKAWSWTEVAAAKRAARDAQLGKYELTDGVSSSATLGADEVDIETLMDLLRSGQVSAEELIRAYIERACKAQSKTNCLTETCFDDAIERARELDGFRQTHGRMIGPLHGVPISVKDQVNVKGLASTLGYVSNAFTPAKEDAPLSRHHVLTNVWWCETNNPLWGLTTHPANSKLTPGGSSGGEAALLSLGGSLIGWGTDIGGSIRIPSHMNGLWGLKPSSRRLSYRGVMNSMEGQQYVPSAIGPMARSLSSLTAVTKLVIEAAPSTTDPQIPPLPWRDDAFQEASSRSLVVGTMLDDGVVKVHPPIERVFRALATKLQAAGHELVEWDTSLNEECIKILHECYSADGGEDIRHAVAEGVEPLMSGVQEFVDLGPAITVYQYWQLNKRKVAMQQSYHDMWNGARSPSGRPVDVLLVPTMPHTAVPHGSCRWLGYTKLFNLLDYTALTFPAGRASRKLDGDTPPHHTPRNADDAWNWGLYDPVAMDGLPVGLQLVGRRFEEEKVLGAAQQIQRLL
ncbi:amidase [Colletotrichum graminicola M1.001]|uniref:amidase n=1 Tax=Colletotrichum graminicola (strain M1.001 / M2 / FGSC 10212) TaxID=645133 RepID=E3Q3V9_COLGM|nr:amidase [Colletotrichum graminicola M1.001]EFQ25711.1 amidase [Colletotrichum graminicola M1.001]